MPIMDAVPLLDSATATILASVNKYTIQQHVKWLDNCIEMPNTYTVYNFQTARPRLETNVPRGPLRGRVGSRRGTTLGNPRFRARARGRRPRRDRSVSLTPAAPRANQIDFFFRRVERIGFSSTRQNQAIMRINEVSDGCTRCCCAPNHSVVLNFDALDPSGRELFPGASREGPFPLTRRRQT